MMATVEQVQSEWLKLISLVEKGEEILITSQGKVVAKLTSASLKPPVSTSERAAWLKELADLRETTTTGKTETSTDKILEDLRSERN